MEPKRGSDRMDFTSHSKRTVTRKLLRDPITISGPVSRTDETLGKDLGNIRPIRFVVECIFGVALRGPSILEFEVRGNSNCEKLMGPFHKEGFSTSGKIWIEHPSSSKAVCDVVNDVLGDLDPELGAIGGFVDFSQRVIHSVLEMFELFHILFWQSVHNVPLVGLREFRGCFDSGRVFGRPLVVCKPAIR